MKRRLKLTGLLLTLAGLCGCIEPPSSYVEWDKQRIERLSDSGTTAAADAGTTADAN
ncbi:MAG: hypothetical protein VYC39_04195 [Myxococcota bacterium]|nr:hypothetical protein [Myxococcota bacterium]